jgi:hypothetical protein
MNAVERELFLRHIAFYLFEQIEAELLLRRGETTFAILQVTQSGVAYIAEGEGIGEVLLDDDDIAKLWAEVTRRRERKV